MSALEPQSIVTLLGDPVAGNPTQAMVEAGFAAAGLRWRYVPFRVDADDLAAAVAGLRALGVRGSHVTVPHKVAVVGLLDELTPTAQACGAVNCITSLPDGRLLGDNTDGRGFVVELARHRAVEGSSVVVLGAGGAARAISAELALGGARRIVLVNRTAERLVPLAASLAAQIEVEAVVWQGSFHPPDDIDVVVNATSIGLNDPNADVPVDLDGCGSFVIVADVIPNPPMTALLRRAANRGLRTITGKGMLVEQAIAAVRSWTGLTLPDAPMGDAFDAYVAVGGWPGDLALGR